MMLLPKSPDVVHPREFRPISLIDFFGKLFTKIPVLQLQQRFHEMASPSQSDFIKKQAIHNNYVSV
jgi:hypothetical protein